MALISKKIVMAALVLSLGVWSSAAKASLVNYTDVSSNGIVISNIQEGNNDDFAPGHYGQPVFVNGVLSFPSLQQFFVTASGGTTSDSSTLVAKLSFTVTMPVATANLFTLNEGGFFAGYGGGAGSIVLGAVITDNGGNPIVGATGTVAPPIPFFAPLPSPQVLLDWTGTLNAVAPTALLTYTVHLDNDLTSSAPAQINYPTFAEVDKKTLAINFPNPGVPEPASLGVLVLGGAALITRRRRA